MSKFFIDRPIFAWVIALIVMIAGGLSILKLPVNQYPDIAPPAISIQVTYPGASAQTVQDTVVQVIEQQLNGIDNLRYVGSESNSDGTMAITVTFNQGTNPDIAQVQVQNKLNLATPLLPQEVQQQGIRVTKAVKNYLIVVGVVSEDGSMSREDLANYVVSNMQDPLSRTPGVGDFQVFGAQYAMRIWLDPAKLTNYQLTPVDVKTAIQAQNVQVSSGQLGGLPALPDQQLNATIIGKTRLQTADEFKDILLKVNEDGSHVVLSDVANITLGGETYSVDAQFNGKPASGIGIRLAPGANALDTTRAIQQTLDHLEPFFPHGLKVVYPYDTTPVVRDSILGVFHTLGEAVVLVFCVMLLFLQNIRATIITTLTVPVVLLGTFGVLAAAGFTINTLTMFGMVLAIGLLVDDAIVVVENVERVMHDEGMSPKDATRKSMEQIQGALVGIAMVLSAVMLPMAFFDGSTGVIYRQFSITIVSAMALSVLTALVFTPALCATLLKPHRAGHGLAHLRFFRAFNNGFERGAARYEHGVAALLRHKTPAFLAYLLISIGMVFLFSKIPTAFLPEEDQGVIFTQIQTPAGSTAVRTQQVLDQVREYLLASHEQGGEANAVDAVFTVNGFNFAGRGQSSGLSFVLLKPWEERGLVDTAEAVAKRAQARFKTMRDAMVFAIVPPAVRELGNASGFDVYLQDQSGVGHQALVEARKQFLQLASQSKVLSAVRLNGLNDEPQYQLLIDDQRARAQGVTQTNINTTLSVAFGGNYVNDFIDRGRVKKVFVQGDASARMSPEDLDKWFVRNASGKMVPFSAFASGKWVYGSPKLARYNGVPAEEILGVPAPGYSTGEAMAEVAAIARQLPPGIGYSWTGLSYEEQLSGSQAPAMYALSILIVFLCLAALYESWSIPLAVMLVVPLGVIGALLATLLRGLSNDVFFQVGLLTTVGLSAKNAILIVEFAKALRAEGMSYADAAINAARQRLRPIVMTSLAFILGVIPLAISHGAGSGSQHAIGTGVIGGMLTATILAIFWVPLFYVAVSSFFNRQVNRSESAQPQLEATV